MKALHTLKFKIALTTTSMLIIFFTLFNLLSLNNVTNEVSKIIEDKSISEVQQIAAQAEILLNYGADSSTLQSFVENQTAKHNYVAYAIIIDSSVTAVAHSDKERIGKSYIDDAYTVDGAKNGNIKTSKYYADKQQAWAYDTIVPIYHNGTLYGGMDVGIYDSYVNNVKNKIRFIQCLLALAVITVVSLLLIISCGLLLAPLQKIAQDCSVISSGDLSQPASEDLCSRKDEIGLIALAIKNIQTGLGDMIRTSTQETQQLSTISEEVTCNCQMTQSASDKIQEAMQDFVNGSQHQSALALETNQMTEEINLGIENAAQTIQTISEVSSATVDKAQKGSEDIAAVIHQMEMIQSQTADTHCQIQYLKTTAQEIEKIVSIITSIASQTNLLALNATIEAARAGEYGKGFNVVATEITTLADQCSNSTSEIVRLIADTNKAIDDVTQMVSLNSSSVKDGVVLAENAGNGFTHIMQDIHHISNEIMDISSVVEEISASTTTLLSSSSEISDISMQSVEKIEDIFSHIQTQSDHMKTVTSSAQDLLQVSENLNHSIGRFII